MICNKPSRRLSGHKTNFCLRATRRTMMNYSEVEKQLIFGYNLVNLRLLLIAYEMKGYPYPTAEVEQTRLTFARQYDVSPDSVPASLKGSDIPHWFLSEIAQQKNQITA